jgi:hypothetical protein
VNQVENQVESQRGQHVLQMGLGQAAVAVKSRGVV